jgi:hypothetical protein
LFQLQLILLVERVHSDFSAPVLRVLNGHRPRLTANLAVFDVLLRCSPARVERDLDRFVAIRAINGSCGLCGSIAQREIGVKRAFVVGESHISHHRILTDSNCN